VLCPEGRDGAVKTDPSTPGGSVEDSQSQTAKPHGCPIECRPSLTTALHRQVLARSLVLGEAMTEDGRCGVEGPCLPGLSEREMSIERKHRSAPRPCARDRLTNLRQANNRAANTHISHLHRKSSSPSLLHRSHLSTSCDQSFHVSVNFANHFSRRLVCMWKPMLSLIATLPQPLHPRLCRPFSRDRATCLPRIPIAATQPPI
jgi:hypothetical protein